MKNSEQKIAYLYWLNSLGIKYYLSDKKDSKISLPNKSISNLDITMNKKEASKEKKLIEKETTVWESNSRQIADNVVTLDELKSALENFDGCELKNFATNVVFSDGIPTAKIMLIGEAPGATEDEQGIPFCGESGKLLDAMLSTIGISRTKNAYITNTVFWRPPANRRPTYDEINICRPFVEKHIALIQPKLLILVGGTATTSLLGKSEGISYIRQNNYHYINQYLTNPILTTAIFHPAYLLRQPMQKKTTWFDLLKIQDILKQLKV